MSARLTVDPTDPGGTTPSPDGSTDGSKVGGKDGTTVGSKVGGEDGAIVGSKVTPTAVLTGISTSSQSRSSS